MSEIEYEILGDLAPHLDEYRGVMDDPDLHSMVQIPYHPDIAADKIAEARKKLPATASYDEFSTLVEKASFSSVPARDHELSKRGFSGTLKNLLAKVVHIDEDTDFTELQDEADRYRKVPVERQKGAKVMPDGYYWGGTFNLFDKS